MAKQLSLSERIVIERMICQDFTFATIARHLHRSASTISREVRNHRGFTDRFTPEGKNDCVNKFKCLRNSICEDAPIHGCYFYRCKNCPDHVCFEICNAYVSERCPRLDKPPYVCTHCKHNKGCKHIRAYYTAHRAQAEYKKQLSAARSGIRKTREDLDEIARIIEPLILRGQSPAHICASHAEELGISERTLYNYIESSVFKVRNLDLPKKVAYRRRRRKKSLTHFEYKYRIGRTYEDFKSFNEANPELSIVEMDTVKGSRTKDKVVLLLRPKLFPQYPLELIEVFICDRLNILYLTDHFASNVQPGILYAYNFFHSKTADPSYVRHTRYTLSGPRPYAKTRAISDGE